MKATYRFRSSETGKTGKTYKIISEDTSNLSAVEKQKAHSKLFLECAEKFNLDVLLLRLIAVEVVNEVESELTEEVRKEETLNLTSYEAVIAKNAIVHSINAKKKLLEGLSDKSSDKSFARFCNYEIEQFEKVLNKLNKIFFGGCENESNL